MCSRFTKGLQDERIGEKIYIEHFPDKVCAEHPDGSYGSDFLSSRSTVISGPRKHRIDMSWET
jgi:hypothetical protein